MKMKKPLYSILLLITIASCGVDQEKLEIRAKQQIFQQEQQIDQTFYFETFLLKKESDYKQSGYFTTINGDHYRVSVLHDGNGNKIQVRYRRANMFDALSLSLLFKH